MHLFNKFTWLTKYLILGYPMNQDVIFDDGPRVEFLSEHLTSLADSVRYYPFFPLYSHITSLVISDLAVGTVLHNAMEIN